MTTTTLERPRNQTSVGTHQDRVPQATSAAPTYRKTAITVGVIYLLGMVFGVGGNIIDSVDSWCARSSRRFIYQ